MDIRKLQRAIVDGLEDVKAHDIVVFNTEHLSPLFERVIIATGASNRQTKALASGVRKAVKEAGLQVMRTEGEDNGEWIIVDCAAAVVHIMQPAIRQYYQLEEIWGDKPVAIKLKAAKTGLVKASEPEEDEAPAKSVKPKKAAGKTTAAKKAATTAPSRQAAAKKAPAAKKAVPKTASRSAAKPEAPGKTGARSAAKPGVKVAAKTVVAKKVAAKKVAAKKAPANVKTIKVNVPESKKAPARKAAAKPVVRKVAAKKVAAKKVAAKKAPARKTAR
jgi:ribosome-associated protein